MVVRKPASFSRGFAHWLGFCLSVSGSPAQEQLNMAAKELPRALQWDEVSYSTFPGPQNLYFQQAPM